MHCKNYVITKHKHSVNASCSYEVHEDIICIYTNGSLEDVARHIYFSCRAFLYLSIPMRKIHPYKNQSLD